MDKVRIITVDREFGSGAAGIARMLAERLGWTLWDQRLTSEIARLAQCEHAQVAKREERMDPLYYRLLKSFLRGSFEGSLNVHRLKLLDTDAIFRLTQRIVHAAADEGNCVLVGRGSAFFIVWTAAAVHPSVLSPWKATAARVRCASAMPRKVSGSWMCTAPSSMRHGCTTVTQGAWTPTPGAHLPTWPIMSATSGGSRTMESGKFECRQHTSSIRR